jgi:hypothetical protein
VESARHRVLEIGGSEECVHGVAAIAVLSHSAMPYEISESTVVKCIRVQSQQRIAGLMLTTICGVMMRQYLNRPLFQHKKGLQSNLERRGMEPNW